MIPRSLIRKLMVAELARSARLAALCEAYAFRAACAIRQSATILTRFKPCPCRNRYHETPRRLGRFE
jgi:hypothetical protein